ncbi:MAG: NAD-dependent epimerase/dehydratase family protein [Planctomycetota bacterium]
MKILFIGGTGNISAACSRLAISRGHDLHLLNRGKQPIGIEGATSVVADISDEKAVAQALAGRYFDAVVNFIAFTPADIERDMRLFGGRCGQYIFISSASAYQKPATSPYIREDTPLVNPHWDYSRNKIAAEERLLHGLREQGFPGVIVRPSLTYDTVIPLALASWNQYTLIQRMIDGKRVVVHGDGTSVWAVTHSDDFAVGLVGLLGHQQATGHAFHITTDELLTWDQMHQAAAAAVGVEARIVHMPSELIAKASAFEEGNLLGDKAVSTIFDNSKIKQFVPDFNPTIRFSDGIRRTLAWFDADPKRKVIDPGGDALIEKLLTAYDQAAAVLQA